MKEWFESWFDTPYYHILYKERSYSEAELFIRNLFGKLNLGKDKKVLDLACGKGRHAIYANSLGYHTTGVDLSAESIKKANEKASENLIFFQHDMRLPIEGESYDLVMNLFTSFGYFDQTDDNIRVLESVHTYLNEKGKLVIDFLNADKVAKGLVSVEHKHIEGIDFEIAKFIENGSVIKDIRFSDKGKPFHFQEKVQLLKLADFEHFLSCSGFEIEAIYGDYRFNSYTSDSDRLIIIAKKSKA